MRKSVLLLLVAFLIICTNGFSFLTGLGVGWYARPRSSAAVAPSPTPPTPLEPTSSYNEAGSQGVSETPALPVFWEAWEIINKEFYSEKPLDYQKIAYGAIRGLIGALEDPHTSFMEPPQREIEKSNYEGKFGGIGALISLNEQGQPVVASVMVGNPAEAAGLQPGDIILEVDAKPTQGLSLDEIILLIRGPVGTTVRLTVQRPGASQLLYFSIVRVEIKQPTVSWKPLDDGRIAYIQLTFFAEPTGDELARVLGEVREAEISQLILDLRGNRGGLLTSAAEVASYFLKDKILLYERYRSAEGIVEEAYPLPRSNFVLDKEQLVVLVDKGSASAAEIVAGAIQDYKRGILVGQITFGKGSVQYLHELSDKSSLHVTTAHWLTPLKRRIHGQGLTPDIIVDRSEDDIRSGRDPQLDRAIEYLVSSRGTTSSPADKTEGR